MSDSAHRMPPVEAGKAWICANGERHFVCYMCHEVFCSDPDFTAVDALDEAIRNGCAPVDDEDTLSVCDDCAPIVYEQLRKHGVIP